MEGCYHKSKKWVQKKHDQIICFNHKFFNSKTYSTFLKIHLEGKKRELKSH